MCNVYVRTIVLESVYPCPGIVELFAIDLDAFLDGSESLVLIHQGTR